MNDARVRARRRARHTPWASLAIIGGLLVLALALATLELGPRNGALAATRGAVALGAAAALGGVVASGVQRLRARRGMYAALGAGRTLLWPAIVSLLALALLAGILPIPYPSPWLSLLAPLVCVGGALWLAGRALSTGAANGAAEGYGRARRAYEAGESARALALARQTLAQHPDDYPTCHLEAIVLREAGALRAARRAADRLVALRPDLYYGYAERGLTLLTSGETVEAVGALEQATARAPWLAEGHYNLGMARAEAGDPTGATEALERALRLGLTDEVTRLLARYRLSQAYRRLGLAREAAAEERWLRRQHATIRRWRQALASDAAHSVSRRDDRAALAEIERSLQENRNPTRD